MKKRILTLTVFSAILTVALYSCRSGLNSISISKDTICSNYNDDISKLPVSLVYDMTDGYIREQKQNIDSTLGIDDARAIWFDLETLKKFVYHIENEAKNNPGNSKGIEKLGVRIYYANYPDSSNWAKPKYQNVLDPFVGDPERSQYGALHTLVMIPTLRIDNQDKDFDPTDPNSYANGLENINTNVTRFITAFPVPTAPSASGNSRSNLGAQNHGALYPPHSGGTSF